MMITGANPNCYPNGPRMVPLYGSVSEAQEISSSLQPNSSAQPQPQPTHTANFLYNLSILKDKTHQVHSLATMIFSPDHPHGQPPPESTAIAIPTIGTLIQEIIVTASSMMFACQQMALGTSPSAAAADETGPSAFFSNHQDPLDHWYGPDHSFSNCNPTNNNNNNFPPILPQKKEITETLGATQGTTSPKNYDIVELDAADLLAKYTHYCQVCGKGFKRDANLRMHMRAHGDEYKSTAALSNPIKNQNNGSTTIGGENSAPPRKYSCPQQGCRWNKNHAKFQPLKSMICAKNHYKRSHCPKMYVCKRCNRKHFSVLSDLRTHEKHCGDLKWQCSCGTTFSRKDKLMGHVALFVGHAPMVNSIAKIIAAG